MPIKECLAANPLTCKRCTQLGYDCKTRTPNGQWSNYSLICFGSDLTQGRCLAHVMSVNNGGNGGCLPCCFDADCGSRHHLKVPRCGITSKSKLNYMIQMFGLEDTMVREFQGNLYVSVAKRVNFAEAENWCKRLGMELATINNSAENEFIKKLANDNKPTTDYTETWIGLQKEGGQWRWRNSAALTYSNWWPFYTKGNKDCVRLYVDDGKWYDYSCSDSQPFVCSR